MGGDFMHEKERNTGDEVTDLSFQTIHADDSPKQVQNWLEKERTKEVNKVFLVNGKTYVIVQLGQKSTGGYRVSVKQIELVKPSSGNQTVFVHYQVKAPKQGSFNIQVLTYPVAIVVLNKEYHIDFCFKQIKKPNKLKETKSHPAVHEHHKSKTDKCGQDKLAHPQKLTENGEIEE